MMGTGEISRVDCGITHLAQIAHFFEPYRSAGASPLISINLHGNQIKSLGADVVNVFSTLVTHLVHLDLSSNELSKLDPAIFSGCRSLKVLNLANNSLTSLEGLQNLPTLQKLLLAYNQISNLVGIVHFHGISSHLEYLDLRENELAELPELYYLSGLVVCHEM
jgi:Leucine-rich repeat (LRR) protein